MEHYTAIGKNESALFECIWKCPESTYKAKDRTMYVSYSSFSVCEKRENNVCIHIHSSKRICETLVYHLPLGRRTGSLGPE